MLNLTHTYVNLPVSTSTFDEIYRLLQQAGYTHAIEGTGGAIDMHGIALIKQEEEIEPEVEELTSVICDCEDCRGRSNFWSQMDDTPIKVDED